MAGSGVGENPVWRDACGAADFVLLVDGLLSIGHAEIGSAAHTLKNRSCLTVHPCQISEKLGLSCDTKKPDSSTSQFLMQATRRLAGTESLEMRRLADWPMPGPAATQCVSINRY